VSLAQVAALACSLERSELEMLSNNKIFLLESRLREFESKTELDAVNRGRLEVGAALRPQSPGRQT